MKCPKCNLNHKHRFGMTCACGYRFTLDPKQDHISDARFLALVSSASSNDTYYFTKNQLVSTYCRREMKGHTAGVIIVAVIGAIISAIALFSMQPAGGPAWLLVLALGLLILVGGTWLVRRWRPDPGRMEAAIRKWLSAGKPLPRLLTEPTLHQPPPEWDEPDIYDYGVESILIVERDLLVDMFVKNGFHSSQRCLVLSETGYPGYIAARAVSLLEQHLDLPTYLLHDSTRKGETMSDRVASQLRLPPLDRPPIDLGLFREDVKRIKRLRPMQPERHDYSVALDYLSYGILLSGLSQALDEQMTLAAVLDAQQASAYDTSNFG